MTRRRTLIPLLLLLGMLGTAGMARAQDEAAIAPAQEDSTQVKIKPEDYRNTTAGELSPAKGFDIFKAKRGSLNISFYGVFRWLDQMPPDQTYTDHLGRERQVITRNDINWHRTMVWLTGFFYDPKFRYNITLWSLPTTQQTLLFGNLRFIQSRALQLGVGIGPNLTARSMQGSWPFWASSDRQMAEDFFRGGFSSSFFITGEPSHKLFYTAAITNNLSQLGVVANNDSRDMGVSASMWWMPSTGEFGPRGGFGDLEHHDKLATRFGWSVCHSRESRYAQLNAAPNATQIRLSDGVLPFETGALADTVTVKTLDYDEAAVDFGFKKSGFTFQGEYYFRRLSKFDATGPLPMDDIFDHGFMAEAMHMVVPKKLGLYVASGYVFDDFKRNPWEVASGANFYPYGSRSWRLNLHVIRVEKSPAGSTFGFYNAGQTGWTVSLGTDVLI